MSPASSATARVSAIASAVAERRSVSNIASSPKRLPGAQLGERDRAAVRVLAREHGTAPDCTT